jgi:SAM-dependent methyltransferase
MGSEAQLTSILRSFEQLLSEIEKQAKSAGPSRIEAVLAQNRSRVYDVLDELGEWLARFYGRNPDEETAGRVRSEVGDWLQELSRTGPIFARMRDLAQGKNTYHELMQHVRAQHPSGANLSAMALNDYYLHARATQAGRDRLTLLAETLEREVRTRVGASRERVDVLCLQYVGGMEWEPAFRSPRITTALNITCVDGSTEGARHAKQVLAGRRGARVHVVRSEPIPYLEAPQRDAEAFNIVYTLSLMERLCDPHAGRLIRGAARLLRPGGVFIAGSLTGKVPTGEKMLRGVMVDWEWQYRDENDWQRLYWGAPFDVDIIRFDYEPLGLGLLVTAQRR